jgi:hypothetical protein
MIKKKPILYIIKAIVSISLLTIIIVNINWDEVMKNFSSANYLFICAAVLLNIIERVELTYKWNLLIWARGVDISFIRLFLINSIGGFWGLFLPSSLGTDVVRGYYLVKNNSEKSVSVSSVFVDRILGMLSLLLLAVISIFFAGDLLSGLNIDIYILALFIIVVFLLYLFQRDNTAVFLEKTFKRVKNNKLFENIVKLNNSILKYKKYPKALFFSFLITMLVQVTRVMTYYFIASAFNISVPIIYFFLFVPIIMLIIMIPVSIGGLGVREGTFIAFFTLVGMSINDAVVISFTNSFINTLITLSGGLVYLFYNLPAKKELISEKTADLATMEKNDK